MAQFHTQRLTAAAALTPPVAGMNLVRVEVFGGSTPGAWEFTKGPGKLYFPAPTNGYARFDVKGWKLNSTNIPSSLNAFKGGISAVVLTYSDQESNDAQARDHMAYRGVYAENTFASATDANKTLTFDENQDAQGSEVAHAILMLSTSTGRVAWPSVGGVTQKIEGSAEDWLPRTQPVMPTGRASSVTVTITADAALTAAVVGYY